MRFRIENLIGGGRALAFASTVMVITGPTQASVVAAQERPEIGIADEASRNKAIVHAAFEKWQAGGNVFAALLAPDVVWTVHGSGQGAGTYRGIDDFVTRASGPLTRRLATPIVPRVHHILAEGDRIVVRFSGSATTTSGEPYRNEFVWIFRMRNGKVAAAEAFLDLVAYQQVVERNQPRR